MKPPADDCLSDVLERFPLRAEIFHTGAVCGVFDFERGAKPGHFHLIRSGRARLIDAEQGSREIDEPSVVFFPDAASHRLVAGAGVDLICANVRFGAGGASPVVGALPGVVVVALANAPALLALSDLMVDEVAARRPGRQATLNRLCELAVMSVLRVCLSTGLVRGGTLAGLADARLSRALAAMHREPHRAWSLDELALLAGMSRARFALQFKQTVGVTPGLHLAISRVVRAQELLREGAGLKAAAAAVGYGSASALTRAFTRVVGRAPAEWRLEAGPR